MMEKKITVSLYDICKNAEYQNNWTKRLIKICKLKKIDFLSTPTSKYGVDHLITNKIKLVKNGSDYLVNIDLIEYMAKKKLKIILSTGMASKKDIDIAIKVIKKKTKIKPILLHCVSQYPTENRFLNLNRIKTLKNTYKLTVGFSDHSIGHEAACQAVSLGAEVFEKHFTTNKNLPGPDHSFSCDPDEMAAYVKNIKESFLRLGSEKIKPSIIEKSFRDNVRLGCVVNVQIKKGQRLKKNHVIFQKNSPGILPYEIKNYLNKKIKINLNKNSILKKKYF